MKVSGKMVNRMVKVRWYGHKDRSMKEIGVIMWLKDMEKWYILLVWHIKVIGKKVYLMEKAFWLIKISNTKVSLWKVNVLVKELSFVWAQLIKENGKTNKEKDMGF